MFYVLSDSFNPYYNLASEEYLLKKLCGEYFYALALRTCSDCW
jgi:lipoate-protein ligase A